MRWSKRLYQQARRDVEELGEPTDVRLAQRALPVEHIRGDAAGPKYGNQVALPKPAGLHENAHCFDRLGVPQRVARFLELPDQQAHEQRQALLFRGERAAARIELYQL